MAKKKETPKVEPDEALSELIYGLKYEQAEAKRNLEQVLNRVQWINDAVFGLKTQVVDLAKSPPVGVHPRKG